MSAAGGPGQDSGTTRCPARGGWPAWPSSRFQADAGVPCQVTVTGHEVGTDARLTVYRVAQEALTNIREHARASRVEIRLAYEPGRTRLIIEDFGSMRPAPRSGRRQR